MADQIRDSECLSQSGTKEPYRLSFFDKDGTKVNVTRDQARCIAKNNSSQLFYFQDGSGNEKELDIEGVNLLGIKDLLPPAPSCPSNPQVCGPPKVQFFGGGGISAVANAIVSPNSSSIIGFDFKSRGLNYLNAPFAQIVDDCGNGSGSSLLVQTQTYGTTRAQTSTTTTTQTLSTAQPTTGTVEPTPQPPPTTEVVEPTPTTKPIPLEVIPFNEQPQSRSPTVPGQPNPTASSLVPDLRGTSTPPISASINPTGTNAVTEILNGTPKGGLEIKNVVILAPGNGYLSEPNGSLGGNGRVWKDVNEGYVITNDGKYYVVPSGNPPSNLNPGDIFVPPQVPPSSSIQPTPTTPVNVLTPPTQVFPTPPTIDKRPSTPTYPVVLEIEEVYILDGGFGYNPGDTLEVSPSNGAQLDPVINDRGEISEIIVRQPGIGFVDMPEIIVNSPTGYNAKLIPVLKSTPFSEIPDPTIIPPGTQFISVVDCVGKIAPKSEFDIVPR